MSFSVSVSVCLCVCVSSYRDIVGHNFLIFCATGLDQYLELTDFKSIFNVLISTYRATPWPNGFMFTC